MDKRLESLPEEIPSAQEIEKAEAYLDEYSELVRRKSSSTDSWAIDRKKSLEALFAGNVPELSEMDCIIEKCAKSWYDCSTIAQEPKITAKLKNLSHYVQFWNKLI